MAQRREAVMRHPDDGLRRSGHHRYPPYIRVWAWSLVLVPLALLFYAAQSTADRGLFILMAVVAVEVAFLGLIPATIAKSKGHSFWAWWVFGLLLLVVALPAAILARPVAGPDRKQCPWCAEFIRREAIVCRCCGRDAPSA